MRLLLHNEGSLLIKNSTIDYIKLKDNWAQIGYTNGKEISYHYRAIELPEMSEKYIDDETEIYIADKNIWTVETTKTKLKYITFYSGLKVCVKEGTNVSIS